MIDTSLLQSDFVEETKERLNSIHESIITLRDNPLNYEELVTLLRELHTIKGSSRMMGFYTIEKLVHGLEDVFKGVNEKRYEIDDKIIVLSLLTCDALFLALQKILDSGDDSVETESFMNAYELASRGESFNTSQLFVDTSANDIGELEEWGEVTESEESSKVSVNEVQSIRVKLEKIDEIIRSFDSLIIKEFKLKHGLELLRQEEVKNENPAITTIRKQMSDDINQMEKSVFSVQHKIFDLRMLPLEIILQPLKRTIERDALSMNKNVSFDIPIENISLDRVILEYLSEILLHLLRNALGHGIETEQQRIQNGKDPVGRISIKTRSLSNNIEMIISDDGSGINYDEVREKAIELYPERTKEISSMSENELSSFLYMSGFSTSKKTSVLSGRGVGLDIVRINMEKIKGKISLKSEKGKGTSFTLSFPLSLATLQGFFVNCCKMKFLVPSHYISEIILCNPNSYILLQNQKLAMVRDQLVPVYNLSSILNVDSVIDIDKDEETLLLVDYLGKKIAIVVDEVLKYVSLVVKPLPPILKNNKALQGVVFDESYSIVPILHIPEILIKLKSLLGYDIKKYEAKTRKKEYSILVVDDSYTTRQIEQTILAVEGYHVDTAVDGINALEKLKQRTYDIIITDIKMPRMDGFVFVDNIRRISEYKETPVVVVSSVYDEEVKQQFYDLGVQAFIIKSDFQRGNLVTTVKELLND